MVRCVGVSISASERHALFEAGRLSWLLHSSQLEDYKAYRKFEADALAARKKGEFLPGLYPRVFIFDCARRYGKDFLTALICIEDAQRRPKSLLTYATSTIKDVTEIVTPLFEALFDQAAPEKRPKHSTSFMGASNQFNFPNGSIIRLVGLERTPAKLRGRHSDGMYISECGFIDALEETISTVILPQMMGRHHANIVLNSTPPDVPGHPYDDLFVPDAREHGRIREHTIHDNPLLTKSDRDEIARGMGGWGSERARRELLCERIRNQTRTVVPEFSKTRHVRASEMPKFARGFTVIDPGVSDLCAVAVGYYDFERAKLVIRRDWAKANAPTDEVARAVKDLERATFGELQYWDSTQFKVNPAARFSDTDLRLITDLSRLHDLKIGAADKNGADAALHALRNAFLQDQIEVHPDAKKTIQHLETAVWNKTRTSYERSALIGHADLLDVVKYMWRHANRTSNPNPPHGIVLAGTVNRDDLVVRAEHMRTPGGQREVVNQMRRPTGRVKIRSPRIRTWAR